MRRPAHGVDHARGEMLAKPPTPPTRRQPHETDRLAERRRSAPGGDLHVRRVAATADRLPSFRTELPPRGETAARAPIADARTPGGSLHAGDATLGDTHHP